MIVSICQLFSEAYCVFECTVIEFIKTDSQFQADYFICFLVSQ